MLNTNMLNKNLMQIKRELWEHKNIVVMLPSILAGIITAIALAVFVLAYNTDVNVSFNLSSPGANKIERATSETQWNFNSKNEQAGMQATDSVFYEQPQESNSLKQFSLNLTTDKNTANHNASAKPLTQQPNKNKRVSLFFPIVFISLALLLLASGMNRDRKDGSIYFWRSLPVSETQHVLTKLFVATVVLPCIYLSIFCISALILLASYNALELIISPSPLHIFTGESQIAMIFSQAFTNLTLTLICMIVALPLIGLTMLMASLFNRHTLLTVIGPIITLTLLERYLLNTTYLTEGLMSYLSACNSAITKIQLNVSLSSELTPLALGIIFGVLCIITSIYTRRRNIG